MVRPVDILRKYGISPNKDLGQNFLADEVVAERQTKYAAIVKDDVVLEIGPGLGVLTRKLLSRGCRVIAIEKDPLLVDILKKEIRSPKFQVQEGDVIKIGIGGYDFNKVVSNLPYNISTEFTLNLLTSEYELAVIMLQQEFAERLTTPTGTKAYSKLTVAVKTYASVEFLETVPSSSFYPSPKVDSAIVRFRPEIMDLGIEDRRFFDAVIDALFSQRRKKIKNTLYAKRLRLLGTRGKVDLSNAPYANKRPEELTPKQLAEIVIFIERLNRERKR